MPTLHTMLLFVVTTVPLALAPGPGMLYVISRAAAQGRVAGVVSALGLEIGTVVHVLALMFGLSALLARVPAAYDAIRLAGGAYLMYLGVRLLWARRSGHAAAAMPPRSLRRLVVEGTVTNLLNPKVALFLLAFLPQFVDVRTGRVTIQMLVLGALFVVVGVTVNIAVGLTVGAARRTLNERFERWLDGVSGAVFIALGLRIVAADRR